MAAINLYFNLVFYKPCGVTVQRVCQREMMFKRKGLCKGVNQTEALVYNPSELRSQNCTTSQSVSAEESQLSKMMQSH